MTSNTAPMGKVSASREQSSGSASYAFNGLITNAYNWSTEGSNDKQWIQYEFEKPCVVTAICVNNNSMTSTSLFSDYEGVLKGSNDGTKWDDLTEITVKKTSASYIGFVEFENTTAYKYYRLLSTKNNVNYGGYNYVQIDEIILYGTPDYESRTYIYDNGVEVMEVNIYALSTYGIAEKKNDYLYIKATSTATPQGTNMTQLYTKNSFDASLYTVVNWTLGKLLNVGSGSRYACINVCRNVPFVAGSSDQISAIDFTKETTLDITNVNGDVHLEVHVNSGSSECSIETLWLE